MEARRSARIERRQKTALEDVSDWHRQGRLRKRPDPAKQASTDNESSSSSSPESKRPRSVSSHVSTGESLNPVVLLDRLPDRESGNRKHLAHSRHGQHTRQDFSESDSSSSSSSDDDSSDSSTSSEESDAAQVKSEPGEKVGSSRNCAGSASDGRKGQTPYKTAGSRCPGPRRKLQYKTVCSACSSTQRKQPVPQNTSSKSHCENLKHKHASSVDDSKTHDKHSDKVCKEKRVSSPPKRHIPCNPLDHPSRCTADQSTSASGRYMVQKGLEKGQMVMKMKFVKITKRKRLRLHACRFCTTFKSRDHKEVAEHMAAVHPYKCSLCCHRFNTEEDQRKHQADCEAEHVRYCILCQKQYVKSRQFQHFHSRIHREYMRVLRDAADKLNFNGSVEDYLANVSCPVGRDCQICHPAWLHLDAAACSASHLLPTLENEEGTSTSVPEKGGDVGDMVINLLELCDQFDLASAVHSWDEWERSGRDDVGVAVDDGGVDSQTQSNPGMTFAANTSQEGCLDQVDGTMDPVCVGDGLLADDKMDNVCGLSGVNAWDMRTADVGVESFVASTSYNTPHHDTVCSLGENQLSRTGQSACPCTVTTEVGATDCNAFDADSVLVPTNIANYNQSAVFGEESNACASTSEHQAESAVTDGQTLSDSTAINSHTSTTDQLHCDVHVPCVDVDIPTCKHSSSMQDETFSSLIPGTSAVCEVVNTVMGSSTVSTDTSDNHAPARLPGEHDNVDKNDSYPDLLDLDLFNEELKSQRQFCELTVEEGSKSDSAVSWDHGTKKTSEVEPANTCNINSGNTVSLDNDQGHLDSGYGDTGVSFLSDLLNCRPGGEGLSEKDTSNLTSVDSIMQDRADCTIDTSSLPQIEENQLLEDLINCTSSTPAKDPDMANRPGDRSAQCAGVKDNQQISSSVIISTPEQNRYDAAEGLLGLSHSGMQCVLPGAHLDEVQKITKDVADSQSTTAGTSDAVNTTVYEGSTSKFTFDLNTDDTVDTLLSAPMRTPNMPVGSCAVASHSRGGYEATGVQVTDVLTSCSKPDQLQEPCSGSNSEFRHSLHREVSNQSEFVQEPEQDTCSGGLALETSTVNQEGLSKSDSTEMVVSRSCGIQPGSLLMQNRLAGSLTRAVPPTPAEILHRSCSDQFRSVGSALHTVASEPADESTARDLEQNRLVSGSASIIPLTPAQILRRANSEKFKLPHNNTSSHGSLLRRNEDSSRLEVIAPCNNVFTSGRSIGKADVQQNRSGGILQTLQVMPRSPCDIVGSQRTRDEVVPYPELVGKPAPCMVHKHTPAILPRGTVPSTGVTMTNCPSLSGNFENVHHDRHFIVTGHRHVTRFTKTTRHIQTTNFGCSAGCLQLRAAGFGQNLNHGQGSEFQQRIGHLSHSSPRSFMPSNLISSALNTLSDQTAGLEQTIGSQEPLHIGSSVSPDVGMSNTITETVPRKWEVPESSENWGTDSAQGSGLSVNDPIILD